MELGRVLTELLVVLAFSRIAAEVSERFRQPAVLGEIILGIVIGPSLLGLVGHSEALRLLGEIGVILLLFEVGRQMDLRQLGRVGGAALRVALIGVVVPMALGYPAVDAAEVGGIAATALAFVAIATAAGAWLVPRIIDAIASKARTEGTVMAAGLVLALGLARLAGEAQLAPIVGAFVAGLAVGRSRAAEDLHRRLTPLGHFFIPIFFLQIGIDTDVTVLGDASVLGVASVLCVCAVVGKLVSGLGAPRRSADRLLVGVAMVPRGEVGLIFASLGLSRGILSASHYGVLLAVVLVTTVLTPPAMRLRIERRRRKTAQPAGVHIEPPGGWLAITDATVDLAAHPPAVLAPRIGLEAALACATRRPGSELIEWLSNTQGKVEWDEELRRGLFAVLESGSPRAWRFLLSTGTLDCLLPGVAAAIRSMPRDPFELDGDPAQGFTALRTLQEHVAAGGLPAEAWSSIPDRRSLLLAALSTEVFGASTNPGADARRVAGGTGLPHAVVIDTGFLAAESGLLPAAAVRPDLDEDFVLSLSAHMERPAQAAALYLLAVGGGSAQSWERDRLDELYRLVIQTLEASDVAGPSVRDVLERRCAVVADIAGADQQQVRQALINAPMRYLLSSDGAAIARHLRMVETRPGKYEARLRPDYRGADSWLVDVAMLNRHGALAAIAGGFAASGVGVRTASIFTWRNGLVIDTFTVSASAGIDWDDVRRRIEASLAAGIDASPIVPIEAEITIDNQASPWHTIVEVSARDRAGLLARVSSALSRAGLDVHFASVATRNGEAIDTFRVTGPTGGKLDDAGERALRGAFAGRVPRRFARRAAKASA